MHVRDFSNFLGPVIKVLSPRCCLLGGGCVKLQLHDYSVWPQTARQLSCVTVACIFWWKGSSIVLSEYILCVFWRKSLQVVNFLSPPCLERFLFCPHTWIVVWLGIAFQDKIIFLQRVMILLAPLLQMSNYYPFDSCLCSNWLDFFFLFRWRFSFFCSYSCFKMFWLCVCNSFFVSHSVTSIVNICQFSGQPNFVVCFFHLFSLVICVLCCNFCCSGSSILLPESKIQNLFLEAFCIAHALDIVSYVDKCEGTVVWMDQVMGEFSQENIQWGQKNMVIREFTSKENSSIANLFPKMNPGWPKPHIQYF